MADTIASILESLGKGVESADKLSKLLDGVKKIKGELTQKGDVSGILALADMEKKLRNLEETTREYNKTREESIKQGKKDGEISEENIQRLNKLEKKLRKQGEAVKEISDAEKERFEKTKRFQAQYEADALQNFRQNKLLGQAYGALTGKITQMAAGLTLAGLAIKAWNRHVQAAELRQNMLIQSFKGFNPKEGWAGATVEATKFGSIMAKAESTALKMGVSTEYVGDSMLKFSRIVGTKSPEALGKLTEGAITVSRAMGITVPEAVDFVATRMDKFGGSAAGALASLNNLREESEDINNSFGRTVVRTDDIVRSLQDISRQTSMYAIDQRMVSSILTTNISKLQASGDSYEQAQAKAMAFTKAVTGEAPEFMKIYSSRDIANQFSKAFNAGNFIEKFGAELDAAKPGLKEEIQEMLNETGGKLNFSQMMTLQEKVAGTTVGVKSMNDEILKMAKHPQGIYLISKMFNVSLVQAEGMVKQSKSLDERYKIIGKMTKGNIEDLQKKYKLGKSELQLTKEQAKEIENAGTAAANAVAALPTPNTKKKEAQIEAARDSARIAAINNIIDFKEQENAVEEDLARRQREELENSKNLAVVHATLESLMRRRAETLNQMNEAKTDADKNQLNKELNRIDKAIKDAKLEKTRYESKAAEQEGVSAGLKTVEEINAKLLDNFDAYSKTTGNYFKALIAGVATVPVILGTAITVGLLKLAANYTGIVGRLEMKLAGIVAKGIKLSGGLGGGSFDSDSGDGYVGTGTGTGGASTKKGSKKQRRKQKRQQIAKQKRRTARNSRLKKGAGIAGIGLAALAIGGYALSSSDSFAKEADDDFDGSDDSETGDRSDTSTGINKGQLALGATAATGVVGAHILSKRRQKAATADLSTASEAVPSFTRREPTATAVGGKPSFFQSLSSKGKNLVGKATGVAGGAGLVGMLGNLFKPLMGFIRPLGKIFGKFTGVIGHLLSVLMDVPHLITSALAGEWKEVLATLAPTIAGVLGGIVGMVGGPAGSLAGSMVGSMAGDKMSEWLRDSAEKDKERNIADKKDKLKDKEELKKNEKKPILVKAAPMPGPPRPVSATQGAIIPGNISDAFGVSKSDADKIVGQGASAGLAEMSNTGDKKEMTGDFSQLNPDGSLTLTVNGFMDVFGQAIKKSKSGIRS